VFRGAPWSLAISNASGTSSSYGLSILGLDDDAIEGLSKVIRRSARGNRA
jgi:hypothetical protein